MDQARGARTNANAAEEWSGSLSPSAAGSSFPAVSVSVSTGELACRLAARPLGAAEAALAWTMLGSCQRSSSPPTQKKGDM